MGYRSTVQDKQLRHLEGRLDAAFWNPAFRKARPVPPSVSTECKPRSRSPALLSGIRLNPLPVSSCEQGYTFPHFPEPQSPARTQYGHLGVLQAMRRSKPSSCDWWAVVSSQKDKLPAPSKRMAELLAPIAQDSVANSTVTPASRVCKDVRVRRIRQPADFGASLKLAGGDSIRRNNSAAATVAIASRPPVLENAATQAAPQLARCSSVPATGTCKADEEAATAAKKKAIVTFQRLFFEEIAKGEQDANDAAARALLRLSESPASAQVTIPATCAGRSVQP